MGLISRVSSRTYRPPEIMSNRLLNFSLARACITHTQPKFLAQNCPSKCPMVRSFTNLRPPTSFGLRLTAPKMNLHPVISRSKRYFKWSANSSQNTSKISMKEKVEQYGKAGIFLWVAMNLSLSLLWFTLAWNGYGDPMEAWLLEKTGYSSKDLPGCDERTAKALGWSPNFMKCYAFMILMQFLTRPVRIAGFFAVVPKVAKKFGKR